MKQLILASVALLVLAAVPATAQTCREIHNLGSSGCAPSTLAGTSVTLQGVVYSTAGTYNSGSTYFNCSVEGGMTFFASGNGLLEGDEIQISGVVSAFGDEIQLDSVNWAVLSSGNPVTPVNFTTGGLAAGTDLLGSFGRVEGVLSLVSSGFNSIYTIDDGSGPCLVFVDGTTGIDTAVLDAMVGDYVCVLGSTKCFGGEGEILPRRDSDIQLKFVATEANSFGELKANAGQ